MAWHSLEEHTGEIELHLEAATLGELFVEAARALAEIMGGPSAAARRSAPEEISLHAPDRNALLVDWLNELIYLAERDKLLFDEVQLHQLSDHALSASISGRESEELQLHVKAATFHGLDICEAPAGFTANVVLDV